MSMWSRSVATRSLRRGQREYEDPSGGRRRLHVRTAPQADGDRRDWRTRAGLRDCRSDAVSNCGASFPIRVRDLLRIRIYEVTDNGKVESVLEGGSAVVATVVSRLPPRRSRSWRTHARLTGGGHGWRPLAPGVGAAVSDTGALQPCGFRRRSVTELGRPLCRVVRMRSPLSLALVHD